MVKKTREEKIEFIKKYSKAKIIFAFLCCISPSLILLGYTSTVTKNIIVLVAVALWPLFIIKAWIKLWKEIK